MKERKKDLKRDERRRKLKGSEREIGTGSSSLGEGNMGKSEGERCLDIPR